MRGALVVSMALATALAAPATVQAQEGRLIPPVSEVKLTAPGPMSVKQASGVYTFSGSIGRERSGIQVTLARLGTDKKITGIASTRTDKAGRYTIRTRLPGGMASYYALSTQGGRSPLYGIRVPQAAQPAAGLTIAVKRVRGSHYAVSGRLTPARSVPVTLGRINTVTKKLEGVVGTATDAQGNYRFDLSLSPGVYFFQVLSSTGAKTHAYGLVVPGRVTLGPQPPVTIINENNNNATGGRGGNGGRGGTGGNGGPGGGGTPPERPRELERPREPERPNPPGNEPPRARFSIATPGGVSVGSQKTARTVEFRYDPRGTIDPEGKAVSFEWDFEDDGIIDSRERAPVKVWDYATVTGLQDEPLSTRMIAIDPDGGRTPVVRELGLIADPAYRVVETTGFQLGANIQFDWVATTLAARDTRPETGLCQAVAINVSGEIKETVNVDVPVGTICRGSDQMYRQIAQDAVHHRQCLEIEISIPPDLRLVPAVKYANPDWCKPPPK